MVIASQTCETKGWVGDNGRGILEKHGGLAAGRANPIVAARLFGKHNRSDTLCETESARLLVSARVGNGVHSTNGDIYQRGGEVGRLWDGRGRNNIALIYSSLDFNINLAYQSHAHPMGDEVVRILRGMAGELSLFGDVLIVGDSTSAYCVGREKKLARSQREIQRRMRS